MHRLRCLILIALPIACAPPAGPTTQYTTPPAPTVTAVTPTLGSADGGASIVIDGTGFQTGAAVRIGGVNASVSFGLGRLYAVTPPHAPGVVNVEVVIGNQSGTLAGAYTYAPPDTIDFNGTWLGYVGESDFAVKFTVEANVVTALSCGGVAIELAAPLAVSNGQFAYTGPGGSISGRIVSPLQSRGTVTIPSCVDPFTNEWWAAK